MNAEENRTWSKTPHELQIEQLQSELAALKQALSDPAAVWHNMLRGTIARPGALDHYEGCKLKLEEAESKLTSSEQRVKELEKALEEFRNCDFNESNCASLSIATARIRRAAYQALSSTQQDKEGV